MTPSNRRYTDSFSPIKSLKLSSSPQRNISSSINSLQDYYGLPPNDQKSLSKRFETIQTNSLLGHHRKSKSEANGLSKICKKNNNVNDKSNEKMVRRRKSEGDLNNRTPEDLRVERLLPERPTESEPFAPNMVPLGYIQRSVIGSIFKWGEEVFKCTYLSSIGDYY